MGGGEEQENDKTEGKNQTNQYVEISILFLSKQSAVFREGS